MLPMLQTVVGMFLGLLLPGYLLARLLRSDLRWAMALPLGLVLLCQIVFWEGLLRVPLTYATILAAGVLLCLVLGVSCWWQELGEPRSVAVAPASARTWRDWRRWWPILALAVFFLIMGYRGWMAPLSGHDTYVRWEWLPKQMLRLQSFSFYPPVSRADFAEYPYPDYVPPLVQFGYFWLYRCWGGVFSELTVFFVLAETLVIGVLAWGLTDRLYGRRAAGLAVCLLLTAPILLWTIAIGQEAGVMVMAMGVCLYALEAGRAQGTWRAAILAGFAVGLAALTREYGGYLLPVALIAAAMQRYRWSRLLGLAGVALLLAGPWYLRNYLRTGNPFCNLAVGSLFPMHPLELRCAAVAPPGHSNLYLLCYFGLAFLQFAGPPLLFALLALRKEWRGRGYLPIAILLTSAIWVLSFYHTAASPSYTERVFAPALLPLACLGAAYLARRWDENRGGLLLPVVLYLGALGLVFALNMAWLHPRQYGWLALWLAVLLLLAIGGERLAGPRVQRLVLLFLLALMISRSAAYMLIFPYRDLRVPPRQWVSAMQYRHVRIPFEKPATDFLLQRAPPGFRVLCTNSYAFVLTHGTSVEMVIAGSPELAFLYDPRLSTAEIAANLRAAGIQALLYYPGSTEAKALDSYPFFAQERPHWQVVYESNICRIYLFPWGQLLPQP